MLNRVATFDETLSAHRTEATVTTARLKSIQDAEDRIAALSTAPVSQSNPQPNPHTSGAWAVAFEQGEIPGTLPLRPPSSLADDRIPTEWATLGDEQIEPNGLGSQPTILDLVDGYQLAERPNAAWEPREKNIRKTGVGYGAGVFGAIVRPE